MQKIVVRTAPSSKTRGLIHLGPLTLPCALGRGAAGILKREGDGKTPKASMKLLYGFWRSGRVGKPQTTLNLLPARQNMIWCDAPASPAYNRLSRLEMQESHETLCREDDLYNICLVMDWNVTSRKRGAGSAIFLHIARPGYRPTEGCIAVCERDMRRLLKACKPGTFIEMR